LFCPCVIKFEKKKRSLTDNQLTQETEKQEVNQEICCIC